MLAAFSASVAVGFDLVVRGVSCLACQRRLRVEENCCKAVASPLGVRMLATGTPLGAEACVQRRSSAVWLLLRGGASTLPDGEQLCVLSAFAQRR